jgi:DNA polymerase-1
VVKKDEQKISDVVPSSVAVSNVAVVMEGLRGILESPSISLDTETTGLRPYHGARFFSVIIADGKSVAYLNFHPEHPDVFDTKVLAELLRAFVGTIYMHNAKFDMHMLRASGIELNPLAHIHCTAAIGRVCYSALPSYSLEYCAKYFCGEDKDDKVKEYILKNGLWEWETVPGKKSRSKNLHYDRVPYELIRPYAEQDARITWKLGEKQRAILKERDEKRDPKYPSIMQVYENECALTKVLFEMESHGVLIDRTFCERALEYELKRMSDAEKLFEAATGKTFKASGKLFAEIFDGEKFEYTDKGNPTFESDVLKKFSSPVAETILEYRDAKSNSNYYAGFLYQADSDDVVHTSFNQNGASTGRFSSQNPNLQNLRKDEDDDLKAEFVPRRAFIPREGHYFAMLDYDAMEYRLMMDYAQAHGLISQVKDGKDVHSATAELAGVTRAQAKTINFTTLYGGGAGLIGERLGITKFAAQDLMDKIFSASPEIPRFIAQVKARSEIRGVVVNWFGRVTSNRDKSYAAVNYLIQGGCADVMKLAMVRIAEFLQSKKTKMVLTIHDELVFEIPYGEAGIENELRDIMEKTYPARLISLTSGIEHSTRSLADKIEGLLPTRQ